MSTTPISATLTQADREAVMTAVATIKEKLPFLIDLTADERKALPKMGDKSRAFVTKALEVGTQNPNFLPRSRQFKSEVHQCLTYQHRIPRKAFCNQAIFEVCC
jgi:hypothetical protein